MSEGSRLVIATGLSGSGKSYVAHALEDNGYATVDNLPLTLLEEYAGEVAADRTPNKRNAVVLDVRNPDFATRFPQLLASLRARVASRAAVAVSAGRLAIPAAGGVYPFAQVASAPSQRHSILTVCTAAPAGSDHGVLSLEPDATGWTVRGAHGGRAVSARIDEAADGRATSVVV